MVKLFNLKFMKLPSLMLILSLGSATSGMAQTPQCVCPLTVCPPQDLRAQIQEKNKEIMGFEEEILRLSNIKEQALKVQEEAEKEGVSKNIFLTSEIDRKIKEVELKCKEAKETLLASALLLRDVADKVKEKKEVEPSEQPRFEKSPNPFPVEHEPFKQLEQIETFEEYKEKVQERENLETSQVDENSEPELRPEEIDSLKGSHAIRTLEEPVIKVSQENLDRKKLSKSKKLNQREKRKLQEKRNKNKENTHKRN